MSDRAEIYCQAMATRIECPCQFGTRKLQEENSTEKQLFSRYRQIEFFQTHRFRLGIKSSPVCFFSKYKTFESLGLVDVEKVLSVLSQI